MTERELVTKANITLEGLGDDWWGHGVVVGGVKLRNGGVIYKMESEQAANRLRIDAYMERFLQHYCTQAVIKPWPFLLMVEYIPLTFDPSDLRHMQELEDSNRLEDNAVLSARWINPPSRQSDRQ
ncbi:hypothetical protein JB92DRAFT_1607576 [Gautieria morchelliformis]|nr:hypothetical protein JB92DRAFT_1607576 [Gautieria morchelliformis]